MPKKLSVILLCFLMATTAFLPEAFALAQEGGKYSRFMTGDLKAQLRLAKEQRQAVPVMPRGASSEERAEILSSFEEVVKAAKLQGGSAGFQQSVRLWESLNQGEKEQVLSGTVMGAAPLVAAAVGAMMLGYVVARDVGKVHAKKAKGKKLETRTMSSRELDFINSLDPGGFGGVAEATERAVVSPMSLDYSY